MKEHKVDFYNESILQSGISSGVSWQDYVYAIPCNGKYIVYQPLKKLSFIANKSMVTFIEKQLKGTDSEADHDHSDALQFLNSIDFFLNSEIDFSFNRKHANFFPSISVLLLTTSCNFHCTYCYASSGSKKGIVMPLETGFSAIDIVCNNAKAAGEDHFNLSFHGGGEPTLAWKEFCQLIKYARSKEIPAKISLSSNGYWSKQKLGWLLENIDEFSLSCDGVAEVHNKQRPLQSGESTFDVVFRSIKALDKFSKPYGIRLTLTESSVDTLPQSIEFFCKETGCGSFQAEPAFNHGRAKANGVTLTNQNRFIKSFLLAYDIAAGYQRNLFYSGARPLILTSTFCQAPFNALIVSNKGLITTCYEVFDSDLDLGDVFFVGKLKSDRTTAIDETKYLSLLSKIDERRQLCRKCFCFWHCAGDCPAKTLTAEGDGHLYATSRCNTNRDITKELLLRLIHQSGGIWKGQLPENRFFLTGKEC
jgi:uncharacterized protein